MTAGLVVLGGLFVVCGGLVYYVYDGYLRLLLVLAGARPSQRVTEEVAPVALPSVTVVVAVFNEAHQIADRISNIVEQDYPRELLQVVVASDGSTDELAAAMSETDGRSVRLVSLDHRVGKSAIQNLAMESVESSIVLFSDASTRFEAGFLRAMATAFRDENVGAVQGHLLFAPEDESRPASSQSRYWSAEIRIRRLESSLGILAVSSGACIALRRELWRPLDVAVGEDCVIPLDVVLQSKRVTYCDAATAIERADDDLDDLISARSRMTLRNWQGTWSRSELLNPFKYPGYSLALWSHKLLRWLSPVWILGATVSAIALLFATSDWLARVPAGIVLTAYLLAAAGAVAHRFARRVPVCSAVYAFFLANVGFLSGLVRAAKGETIRSYR